MAETKTEAQRNIYEKMTAIKMKLLGIKKSGHNGYSDYDYFELGDILSVLTPALQEEHLYMKTEFSVTEPIAKLIIFEMDDPNIKLEFETRVGTCTLKASHDIQNIGAAQTYTRRYLIINAFDISDADILDGGAEPEKPEPKQKQTWQGKPSTPPKPRTPPKSETSPQSETLPQDDIQKLKRDAWELIKKLPDDQKTQWLDKCKEANAEALKDIINTVAAIFHGQPDQAKQSEKEFNEEHKERVIELKTRLIDSIRELPPEAQDSWLDAVDKSNSIAELTDYNSQLYKALTALAEVKKQAKAAANAEPIKKNQMEIM